MIGIGIAGIAGRMGHLLAAQVRTTPGATLTGGIDRAPAANAERMLPDIAALAAASDVVIDFTHAGAVRAHAEALTAANTAWVLGTTGLDSEGQEAVRTAARAIAVMQAANYSPGVALVIALAERLGAALPASDYDAEILETHHRQKVDAPSGTALAIGEAVARGRGHALAGAMESGRHGQTGPRQPGAIGFASLRAGQVVGEHTLLFASASEQITLRHQALDRGAFAAGAIRAAVWLHGRPAGLYGMPDVLGLR